jgi:hypothetical protein
MRVAFKHFESRSDSWQSMFDEAAAFASAIGPERLVGISHSHGGGSETWGVGGSGVVTVWYWEQAGLSSPQAESSGATANDDLAVQDWLENR